MTGKRGTNIVRSILLALIGLSSFACASSGSGTSGDKQTNWLRACDSNDACIVGHGLPVRRLHQAL